MDRLVSFATPLIYLAHADQMMTLRAVAREVFIPQAVYREVVVEGKRLCETDAYRVDKGIREGWIVVREVEKIHTTEIPLHPGEAEVISLAIETSITTVLMDDGKGRAASELAGLKPIGTIGILLKTLQDHQLDFDQFLSTLQAIVRAGFYLTEDVYLKVIEVARAIAALHTE